MMSRRYGDRSSVESREQKKYAERRAKTSSTGNLDNSINSRSQRVCYCLRVYSNKRFRHGFRYVFSSRLRLLGIEYSTYSSLTRDSRKDVLPIAVTIAVMLVRQCNAHRWTTTGGASGAFRSVMNVCDLSSSTPTAPP